MKIFIVATSSIAHGIQIAGAYISLDVALQALSDIAVTMLTEIGAEQEDIGYMIQDIMSESYADYITNHETLIFQIIEKSPDDFVGQTHI